MKKSSIAAIVIIVLLVIISNYYYTQNKPKDFPHPDVFTLNVSCDESVPVGEEVNIDCTLSNTGDDYDITYHNSIFQVFIDGKNVTEGGNNTTTVRFSHGDSNSKIFSFVPDKAGPHEIKVITDFEIDLSSTDSKKYSYQKSVSINAVK